MDLLDKKRLKTTRGLSYAYYVLKDTSTSSALPTILFLHGFPDSSSLWFGIIERIAHLQYPIMAIDILGMGDSDKPTDPQLYNFKDHSADLQEILDKESVSKVVVVGHDAGAVAAQRFYLFQPKKVVGMILLNVAYKHPSYQPFDLPKLIQLMRQLFGYDAWAYWDYTSSDRAAGIINKNPVLMYEALHGDRPDWMKTVLGNFGALEAYTKGETERVPVKAYAKPGQEEWVEHVKRHGIDSQLCWYRATVQNVQSKVENEIPPERLKMNFPVMFIACTDDAACRAEMMKPAVAAGLLPDLETNWLNCGHWSPLERPGEISGMIISYMSRHFSAA